MNESNFTGELGKKLVNRKIIEIIISNLIIQYFFYFVNSFSIHVYDVTKNGYHSVFNRLLHAFHFNSILYFIVSGIIGITIIIRILCPLFEYIKNQSYYDKARKVTIKMPFVMLIMYAVVWIFGSVTSICIAYSPQYNLTALITEFLCDFSTGILSAMFSIYYIKNTIIDLKKMLKITDIRENEKDVFAKYKCAFTYLSLLFFILAHGVYIVYFYFHEAAKVPASHFYYSAFIISVLLIAITIILFKMERKENIQQTILVLEKLNELCSRDDNFSEKLILLNFDDLGRVTDRVNTLTNKLMKKRDLLDAKVKERTAELEKVLAMKNELFYMLNHDIKNIFSSIVGAAGVLSIENLPARAQEFIKIIQRNSKIVLSLTDDFLQMMIADAEGINARPLKENISSMLSNVAGTFRDVCDLNGVSLSLEDIPPVEIFVDTEKMYMCFSNIISNAVKFTPSGGTIKVSGKIEGKFVEIHVKDSGIGIPEDKIKTIFEPLKKAHSFGVRGEKGSGLGLAIVKKIVELHGGQIGVNSIENQGSDFWIKLPLYNKKHS